MVAPKINTRNIQLAYDKGESSQVSHQPGWKSNLQFLVIYGKSGGSAEAINLTETIIEAIIEERNSEPCMAAIIVGDFNTSTDKLTNIKDLIEEESWTDLGANANIWEVSATSTLARPAEMPKHQGLTWPLHAFRP